MWKARYKSGPERKEKEEYACINCQEVSTTLYREYSEGVIRLTDCEKCSNVVDKYIEYDVVSVVIDLMIQYVQAYRHLLLNVRIPRPERLFVIFWLSHAAEVWIRERDNTKPSHVGDQEWIFYRCLLLSAVEILSFVAVIMLYALLRGRQYGWKQIIASTVFGFYGNVAVVLSFVFHLSHRISYQFVMQIFFLVSHYRVQQVLFPSHSISDNTMVVLVAKTVSTFTGSYLTSSVLP